MKHALRYVLLAVGTVSLALGVVGMFLPMWPTTPFLLLAAACFVRSSERMHRWLVEHEQFGCYVRDFLSGRGIPRRAKRVAIATMWVTTQASWLLAMGHLGVSRGTLTYAAVLVAAPAAVTWYLAFRVPTREDVCDTAAAAGTPGGREAVRGAAAASDAEA